MSRHSSRTVAALALVLAAGSATAKAPDPAHIVQAQNQARSLRAQLGLSEATDFQVHHAFTNEQGSTIVRLQQTHQGFPVWSSTAIVHVAPDGTIEKVINGLVSGIQLSGSPALSADQAKAIALQNLAARGPLDGVSVTQVAYPSRHIGGFVTTYDPATGKTKLDRDMSSWAKRPAADYVWAYVVSTSLRNGLDGMKQMTYVIDGNTGAILRKWNNLKSDSPAQGTGNSLYNGTVVLNTTQSSADGSYKLIDPTRGTAASHNWAVGNNVGQSTYYTEMVKGFFGPNILPTTFTGNTTNAWGDGQPFTGTGVYTDPVTGAQYWTGANSANGQTAAVDAQFGLAATWDLFANVFGRNGMDNAGLTLDAVVHDMVPNLFGGGAPRKRTNHFFLGGSGWFSWGLGTMYLGDGSYPEDPDGTWPQTETDIVGHEATHALTFATVNFDPNSAEPPALEEATCDVFGQAVKAYALRASGADSSIPDFPTDLKYWTFGYQAGRGNPERYLYKPSLDGISPDGWYDGIGNLMPWYASGPINRMFFFLSVGASANASDPTYSVYLPGGMTGIGIDKATRIWYKALTEELTSESTMQDAVTAADSAAVALYGQGSAEETAVLNAFYAVNIGDGAGEPKHVQVTLPVLHPAGSLLGNGGTNWQGFPSGYDGTIQFYPPATSVKPLVNVANTSNTAVTWSAGGVGNQNSDIITAGNFNADGTWTTPVAPNADFEPIYLTVASQADPNQIAKLRVIIVVIDADMDSEPDALDLGQIAMVWGLKNNPFPSANIWSYGAPGDWDVALFNEVLTNTWPVK
jgi:Zn-dependent metalloprotease